MITSLIIDILFVAKSINSNILSRLLTLIVTSSTSASTLSSVKINLIPHIIATDISTINKQYIIIVNTSAIIIPPYRHTLSQLN